ncbi:CYTH domain-containing protein [candidate division KSB1 bacterium]|nr:CYTH domain-containing protein [candidate division KSB1 bacterium]
MAHEIERKFLVKKLPEDLNQYPSTVILQGYLAITSDGTEVRLRKKGSRYFQTVKSGSGLLRGEVEIELSQGQFEKLWLMTEGKRIEKIRYEIAYSGTTIELDVFSGMLQGLVVAEVEFVSIKQANLFIPPSWFGIEVTEDERYKNRNLALCGISETLFSMADNAT